MAEAFEQRVAGEGQLEDEHGGEGQPGEMGPALLLLVLVRVRSRARVRVRS